MSDPERTDAPTAGAGLVSASKFLGRLAQLDVVALGTAIRTWRSVVGETGDSWFAAEHAVATAIHEADRYAEQAILLRHMTDLFLSTPWFTIAQPGARIGAAEPAGQYVATVALLALLVRDRLAVAEFEVLYRPFAHVIPVDELARE